MSGANEGTARDGQLSAERASVTGTPGALTRATRNNLSVGFARSAIFRWLSALAFRAAAEQLIYIAIYAGLIAFARYNRLSLDAMRKQSTPRT